MRKIALATHYTNNKKEIEQITESQILTFD